VFIHFITDFWWEGIQHFLLLYIWRKILSLLNGCNTSATNCILSLCFFSYCKEYPNPARYCVETRYGWLSFATTLIYTVYTYCMSSNILFYFLSNISLEIYTIIDISLCVCYWLFIKHLGPTQYPPITLKLLFTLYYFISSNIILPCIKYYSTSFSCITM